MPTAAPRAARQRVIAAPMPREPPVTTAFARSSPCATSPVECRCQYAKALIVVRLTAPAALIADGRKTSAPCSHRPDILSLLRGEPARLGLLWSAEASGDVLRGRSTPPPTERTVRREQEHGERHRSEKRYRARLTG